LTRTGDAAVPPDEVATEFASAQGSIHNHFNQERHLINRKPYKERRSAALAAWWSLAA